MGVTPGSCLVVPRFRVEYYVRFQDTGRRLHSEGRIGANDELPSPTATHRFKVLFPERETPTTLSDR